MTNTELANATSIMLGTTQASAMYIGNTLVWSNNTTPDTIPYDAEIEYLEGTGTQWIDTLIHPTTGYGFELYGGFTEFNNNEFFGGGNNWDNGLGICTHEAKTYGVIVGTTEVCTLSAQNNVMHLFRVNSDGTVYVDNECKGQSGTQMPEGNYTMYIFNHSSTRAIRKAKIYYCKIFNSNGLVFDGIPVRVGQVGYMYDKISRQLFSNEGSGNFVLGPDKLPSGYTQV